MSTTTTAGEEFLENLAAELEIPDSRYEAAERSYNSVGEWLQREGSSLRRLDPEIYPQGSFRLGTVTKPADDSEHYDLDIVCELAASKSSLSQQEVKELLGVELEAYAEARKMAEPGESRRCWTLEYADGAQFHMDVLPALPDGKRQRLLLEQRGLDASWSETGIAITDRDHPAFRIRCDDWPSSNPRGYASWFVRRMQAQLERNRRVLAESLGRKPEEIPDYRVKTPLQRSIQILKRHRDVTFSGNVDDRPISVILTTLAALSYRGEERIASALSSILRGMEGHILERGGTSWVPNPTDSRENFADRWQEFPERRRAFFDWLRQAQEDFGRAASVVRADEAASALAPRMGDRLVEAAATRKVGRNTPGVLARTGTQIADAARSILTAPYRATPVWPSKPGGVVSITEARSHLRGHKPRQFLSGGPFLAKNARLTFRARTTVRRPFRVYWQVTNTGPEALAVRGGGRGTFVEGVAVRGKLTHEESTLYKGGHGIECFIVKEGNLVARSGVFVVNIA